jgi:hypothetical protein
MERLFRTKDGRTLQQVGEDVPGKCSKCIIRDFAAGVCKDIVEGLTPKGAENNHRMCNGYFIEVDALYGDLINIKEAEDD